MFYSIKRWFIALRDTIKYPFTKLWSILTKKKEEPDPEFFVSRFIPPAIVQPIVTRKYNNKVEWKEEGDTLVIQETVKEEIKENYFSIKYLQDSWNPYKFFERSSPVLRDELNIPTNVEYIK